MCRALTLIPVVAALVACAKKDAPPADTAASVVAVAPAALTEADIAGTWTGVSMPMASDSVVARWTQVCAAGTCDGTTEGTQIKTRATYILSGDSSVGVSAAYTDPTVKGGQVIDNWVAHINGDSATGTGMQTLASKPDSVVVRWRFAGARTR